MQRKRLWFRISRILFYVGVLAFFFWMPYEAMQQGFFRCPATFVGLQCPGCGATRALSLLLHGRLWEAWEMNGVFCGVIFPLLLLTAIQDTGSILLRKNRSFLEYLLGI